MNHWIVGMMILLSSCASQTKYPDHWFSPVEEKGAPSWEILPQAAQTGEVILSKRNELGILSNFAPTPFTFDGVRYASLEGFWQMMLYPDPKLGDEDERLSKKVKWKYTREQVSQMVAFEAKSAGSLAEANMKTLEIDWCSYQGEKMKYREPTPGRHYELIVRAMREKLKQNPKVREVLLSTGDLKLLPDHHQEVGAPPEWKYNEIWMQIRKEIRETEKDRESVTSGGTVETRAPRRFERRRPLSVPQVEEEEVD